MIFTKYAFFAAISSLLNLLTQYLSFFIYTGYASLYIAMFVGTSIGLFTKYILDKKFIFHYDNVNNNFRNSRFFYYLLTGILTTSIFWGTEIAFFIIYSNQNAKYIGALIGLVIGYLIKYILDKRYVFI